LRREGLYSSGVAYVCFIVDAFSRTIVGWRVASHMRTDMVLDAIEIARFQRGTRLEGLICHSGAGSQFKVPAIHRAARRERHRRVGQIEG
jgi:transposase InsO family protein